MFDHINYQFSININFKFSEYGVDIHFYIISKLKEHPDRIYNNQIIEIIDAVRDSSDSVQDYEVYDDIELLLEDNTNRAVLKNVLHTKNFFYIKSFCEEYERISDTPIEDLINRVFPNDNLVLQNIVRYAKNPAEYFAFVIKSCMKTPDVNEILLTSSILMRCEVDMIDIKREFHLLYGMSLWKCIRGATYGYYKYALYELIREERPHQSLQNI